tara:strand:- start:11946 stop:16268 length:4323 start_codon:yes stop_codon:yes gene_type:complete
MLQVFAVYRDDDMARRVNETGFEGLEPGKLGPLHIDAGGSESLLLPRGMNLSSADYTRQGDDLLIIDKDGDEALISGYFSATPPADLVTETGAVFDGGLISRLAGPLAPGQYAQSAVTDAAATPIGKIETLEGSVVIIRADGTRVEAVSGDSVFQGDVLETGDNGAIGIIFIDETTFSLGANGRMVLDELIYDPDTQSGSSTFSLVQGVFSFVSGSISKTGVDAMTIKTPVATIGIRGTAGSIDLPEGEQLTVVLTAEPDGSIGEITVFNSAGVQVLNSPFDATQVTGFNVPPAGTFSMTVGEFNQRFSEAVRALPAPSQGNQPTGPENDSENEEAGPSIPGEDEGSESNADDDEASEEASDVEGVEEVAGPDIPEDGSELDGEGFGPEITGTSDDSFAASEVTPPSPDGSVFQSVFPSGGSVGIDGVDLGGSTFTSSGTEEDEDDRNDVDFGQTGTSGVIPGQTIYGDSGANTLTGGLGGDTIFGGGGSDTIFGLAGGDTLSGDAGDDTVYGGLGDDTLIGGTGAGYDTYDGGAGQDWVQYSSVTGGVTVDLDDGFAYSAETDSDDLQNIEHVTGGSGGDTITGSSAANSLLGNAGGDTLFGFAGNDFIDAGAGDDTVDGGSGSDSLLGGDGSDTLIFSGNSGVVANLSTGTSSGAGTDSFSGFEHLSGTGNGDTLTGDTNANRIAGGGGDDKINGGAGNDTLSGDAGNDTFTVGSGYDTVSGGAGSQDHLDLSEATSAVTFDLGDTAMQMPGGGLDAITTPFADIERLTGSAFNDHLTGSSLAGNDDNYIDGGAGDDLISAGSGTNTLTGGAGNDTISGSANADTITGGAGNDTLEGGSGNDSYVYANGDGSDSITDTGGTESLLLDSASSISDAYRSGNDLVISVQSGAQLTIKNHFAAGGALESLSYAVLSKVYSILTGTTGDSGDNFIVGSTTDDTITANSGNNLIFLSDGNDTAFAGIGNDSIVGGNGNDSLDYTYASGSVTVDLTTGVATGAGTDAISGFENLKGSTSGDTLTGDSGSNVINGSGGNDILAGLGGDDTLIGGSGVDRADYSAATAGVTVNLNTGQATGGAGNDSLSSIEQVAGSDYGDTLTGSSTNYLLGGGGDDLITSGGLSSSDTLVGGAGNDTLNSGIGGGTLDGGVGNDTLNGGSGSDTYLYAAGDGNDSITESGGTDRIVLSAATSFDSASRIGDDLVLTVNGGANIILKDHYNGQPIESLDVGALSTVYNILTGLTGSPSNELIVSGSSSDVMAGGSGNDAMFGGAGNDELTGANGNDSLHGGDGADTLSGGSGNDTLLGGAGNDTLDGGEGSDILYLGAGNDTVLYTGTSDLGDTIMDFSATEDTLSFDGSAFGGLIGGTILGAANFASSTVLPGGLDGTSGTPTFIFFDSATGNDALYYDEDGSGSGFTVTKVADFNGNVSGFSASNIFVEGGGQ